MAKISAKEIFNFVKLLRIDLFFFFATLSTSLPNLALNQLIQDKFCINKYLLNKTDCFNLEKSSDFETIQNEVLKETTSLKLYITLMTTIPSIFLSLIMGYWVDKYPSHLRYLLGVAAMANVCANIMAIYQCIYFEMDPYLLLLTCLVPVLTGSGTLVSVGTYTYATKKTPAKYRSIRFTVLELFLFATIPIANLAGGGIVASKPWFANQLRNYIGVYIVSSVCAIFAAIWVVIFLYDSVDETKSNEPVKVDETSSLNAKVNKKSLKQIIYDVIKPNNILIATRCVFKRRPNNAHWFLISNIVAGFLANIGYLAEQNIGYQFSQRVYHWSASQIGLFNSVIIVFPAMDFDQILSAIQASLDSPTLGTNYASQCDTLAVQPLLNFMFKSKSGSLKA
uniref:Major facilitator superfamily (MFS) profile domain-containing protein n=1 Tax=Tetranychus urticae TaxID=32264 RepID=T1L5G4_TETUR